MEFNKHFDKVYELNFMKSYPKYLKDFLKTIDAE